MALTVEQANELVETMQMDGIDAEVREDYSGRGMYGDKVVGITLPDEKSLIALGWYGRLAEIEFDDLPKRTDSLGRGIIVY